MGGLYQCAMPIARPNCAVTCAKGVAQRIDMAKVETPVEIARRRVAEQEASILRQEQLIERLTATGQPTKVAEQVLALSQRILLHYLNGVAQLTGVGPDS